MTLRTVLLASAAARHRRLLHLLHLLHRRWDRPATAVVAFWQRGWLRDRRRPWLCDVRADGRGGAVAVTC